MTAYNITPATITNFYDETIVADLVSDGGDQVAVLETDPKLLKLIAAAEGRVESACTVAKIYSTTKLAALTGNSLALLEEIVSGLVMIALLRRRPGTYDEIRQETKGYEDYLDRLRKGERIFGGNEEAQEAGLPQVDGPTTAIYDRLNLIPDRTRNFYPSRIGRLPVGRG